MYCFLSQDNISRNYQSIRLKPDQFSSYLTTEVGFASFEHLGAPKCSIRGNSTICQCTFITYLSFAIAAWWSTILSTVTGFQRPIYLFHKWPLLPWRSLNVSSLNYKTAGRPGLWGIIVAPKQLLQLFHMLKKKKSPKEKRDQNLKWCCKDETCLEDAPIRIFCDCKFLQYRVNSDKSQQCVTWSQT